MTGGSGERSCGGSFFTEQWALRSLFRLGAAEAWVVGLDVLYPSPCLPMFCGGQCLLSTIVAAVAHCAHRPFPRYRNQQEPALTPPPASGVAEKHRRRDPVVVVGR